MKKIIFMIAGIFLFTSSAFATGSLMPPPKVMFWDANGKPCRGCRLCTFDEGTTTNKSTYSDEALSVANTNPVILNSRGEATIFLDGKYKIRLQDRNQTSCTTGTSIWTQDNVSSVSYEDIDDPPDEWKETGSSSHTYVSGTQFSTTGDTTSTFQVGRRVHATSAGELYGRITASSYAASVTTVTVAWDSGTLDSGGITAMKVSVPTVTNKSLSFDMLASGTISNSLTSTFSGATTISGALNSTNTSTFANAQIKRRGVAFYTAHYDSLTLTHTAAAAVTNGYVAVNSTSNLTSSGTLTTSVPIIWDGGTIVKTASDKIVFSDAFEAPPVSVFTGFSSDDITGLEESRPEWFGAVRDGATSDTTAVQNSIDSLGSGGTLLLTKGDYRVSGLITFDTAAVVKGYGAIFSWASDTTADRGIRVTASDVEIYGIELNGPQHAATVSTQIGIFAYGADSSNYLTGIVIQDCNIHDWGESSIQGRFLSKAKILNNNVHENYASGIKVLSDLYSMIKGNHVWEIGITKADDAYGIGATKNNGTEAVYPVSKGTQIHSNIVNDVRTWNGIDTHGGHYLSIVGNEVYDCLQNIHAGSFIATPGSESAPTGCVISNNIVRNNHGAGELVAETDQQFGIFVGGYITSGTFAKGNVISNNTIEGQGDLDVAVNGVGALYTYYHQDAVITGNTVRDSGRHAVSIKSCPNINLSNNVITTVTGTTASAATGTITFAGNPSNGDTITMNGAVYTFVDPAAPATDYEIDIKGTLELTLDETTRILNLAAGDITSLPTDGRVSLATYSNNATVLTITFDTIGRSGLSYTLAASVATVSGANLTQVTSTGSTGINFHLLSGAGAGESTSGIVANNVINVGAYTAIQMDDDNTSLDFFNNVNLGTGPLYDLKGSGSTPNSGAGTINYIGTKTFTYDLPSISAAASYTVYVPTPGSGTKPIINVTPTRTLDGLTMSVQPTSNYFLLRFDNPSAGAVNLASSNFRIQWGQVADRQ